jgi:hypothetical protein
MANSGSNSLFWLFIIVGIAAIGWMFRDLLLPQPEMIEPVPAPVETPVPVEDSGPLHPIDALTIKTSDWPATKPLPPLDDSDAYFLLETGSIFGADIEALLIRDAIIDRFVATVDNLSRKHVSHKIRPVQGLATPFVVEGADDSDTIYLGADNFHRYDALVAHIASADLDDVTDMYRRYYPLFQKSYERLGYPKAYFNDRLVEVIDLMLSTPETDAPLVLVRPNVLYQFADPALEDLSSGQKLLLRIGNEHAATVKEVLRQLRSRLVAAK